MKIILLFLVLLVGTSVCAQISLDLLYEQQVECELHHSFLPIFTNESLDALLLSDINPIYLGQDISSEGIVINLENQGGGDWVLEYSGDLDRVERFQANQDSLYQTHIEVDGLFFEYQPGLTLFKFPMLTGETITSTFDYYNGQGGVIETYDDVTYVTYLGQTSLQEYNNLALFKIITSDSGPFSFSYRLYDLDSYGLGFFRFSINFNGEVWVVLHFKEIETTISEKINTKPLIYPNPATDHIQIKNYNGKYTITSSLGQTLKRGVIQSNESIHISDITPGLYLISFGNTVEKIIKQ